ncbi:MAG: CHC2 zinc finger domain-containing protein [Candidatus Pacebacteria bacterium]|nr:CHC2 zinc finger domain-containing protein [Candidatus Paceibacterota bacterium]
MGKIKIKNIDSWKVNNQSITQVIQDWGVEIYPRGRYRYAMYCPNPKHGDKRLGNCVITENGTKNCFYCFACGEGGGPIDFVMLKDKCDFRTALTKIAQKYGLVDEKLIDPKDMPPKWTGLSHDEYNTIGLKNPTIKIPIGVDKKGHTIYRYERYALRDFAREDPQAHDFVLYGKVLERLVNLKMLIYILYEKKPSKTWLEIDRELSMEYRRLYKKGQQFPKPSKKQKNQYDNDNVINAMIKARKKIEKKYLTDRA